MHGFPGEQWSNRLPPPPPPPGTLYDRSRNLDGPYNPACQPFTPAILWQPTRPTPPNLFFTTPFLKTNRESSAFPPVLVPLFVIRRLGCTEFLLSVFSLFSFFLISISSSRRSPILVALGGLYILQRKLVGGGSGYLIKIGLKGEIIFIRELLLLQFCCTKIFINFNNTRFFFDNCTIEEPRLFLNSLQFFTNLL